MGKEYLKELELKSENFESLLFEIGDSLENPNCKIYVYYNDEKLMRRMEEEILENFGEIPLEYGKIKFKDYTSKKGSSTKD